MHRPPLEPGCSYLLHLLYVVSHDRNTQDAPSLIRLIKKYLLPPFTKDCLPHPGLASLPTNPPTVISMAASSRLPGHRAAASLCHHRAPSQPSFVSPVTGPDSMGGGSMWPPAYDSSERPFVCVRVCVRARMGGSVLPRDLQGLFPLPKKRGRPSATVRASNLTTHVGRPTPAKKDLLFRHLAP